MEQLRLDNSEFERFKSAVNHSDPVSGYTHTIYRYPARFSPQFAREAIRLFSQPNDLVLDPFMGGGTTLVEALAEKRNYVGIDISPLAEFVTRAKTTMLEEHELSEVVDWSTDVLRSVRVTDKSGPSVWRDTGYQKDVPWALRKSIEAILERIPRLKTPASQDFAKCVLLRTAQWAIDCRDISPSAEQFRLRLAQGIGKACLGMRELHAAANTKPDSKVPLIRLCMNRNATGMQDDPTIARLPMRPKLVLTSPPYPGVHVLYHQWQVESRKRTGAPFWIIGSQDGHGSPHYTLGHYQQKNLTGYFENALNAFSSIRSVMHPEGLLVQLVGFAEPVKYFPLYLEMMRAAGYSEVAFSVDSINRPKRIWRDIPNRRWYAKSINRMPSSREVVLVHKLS